MGWTPRRVSITADGPTARVVLDDADVSEHITGYTLEQHVGQTPVLVLHPRHSDAAFFEGMAQVAVAAQPEEQDQGAALAAFLEGIDAGALETAAINRDDLDDERYGVTRAVLRQLAEWVQGKGGA